MGTQVKLKTESNSNAIQTIISFLLSLKINIEGLVNSEIQKRFKWIIFV